MSNNRGKDLAGRALRVAPKYRSANPRAPYTHGWLAFEILRRAPNQQLTLAEYASQLFHPTAEIHAHAEQIPGLPDGYQDLKCIRCDIYRGTVLVEPRLSNDWFGVSRCSKKG
jgi:hypothetical protein